MEFLRHMRSVQNGTYSAKIMILNCQSPVSEDSCYDHANGSSRHVATVNGSITTHGGYLAQGIASDTCGQCGLIRSCGTVTVLS